MTVSGHTREQFSSDDRSLLTRVSESGPFREPGDCSQEKLLELVASHGLDFTTALLYERIRRDPKHQSFFERVHSAEHTATGPFPFVAIIPGAFYREHKSKSTGADGERLAGILRSMNCEVDHVPIESFGSLERNAAIITDWLQQRKRRPTVVISLSKGSADMKLALARRDASHAFSHVEGWISLSGLPQGTPLVGWLDRQWWRKIGVRLLLCLRRQKYSVVEQLRHGSNAPLSKWPRLPGHLRLIHVIAFPLRRHLAHEWALRGYERLAPLGPNDGGGFLLGDALQLPGTVYPVWGADHYLQPAWDTTPVLRRVFEAAIGSAGRCLQTT